MGIEGITWLAWDTELEVAILGFILAMLQIRLTSENDQVIEQFQGNQITKASIDSHSNLFDVSMFLSSMLGSERNKTELAVARVD